MLNQPYSTDAAYRGFTAMRVVLAAMMFIHGATRLSIGGGVADFGGYLDGSGVPGGLAVAWLITLMEVTATVVLASGRLVRPLALYFAFVLTMGIIMVHGPNGWFVVGAGRNGVEFSVLLICGFLTQAWAAGPLRDGAAAPAR